MSRASFTVLALILNQLLWAQSEIPIGTWRTHLSYRSATGVATTDGRVYCLTDKGLFYFDTQERTLTKVTRVDGLSGVQTSTIGYHAERDLLMLTYQDGNIDLIEANQITEFGVLKNSTLMGNKGVVHVTFLTTQAFLSSELGMIVMNLEKVEIKEAYTNLGVDGMELAINASTILDDSLFLATEMGIISASLSDQVNRLDYRNWQRPQIPGGDPTPLSTSIATYGQTIFTSTTSGFYSYSQGSFKKIDLPVDEEIKWLQVSNDRLVITMETSVILMDPAETPLPKGLAGELTRILTQLIVTRKELTS